MSTQDRRIDPSDISPDILRQIGDLIQEDQGSVLVGQDGERIPLPKPLNDLLLYVVQAMNHKQAIVLMPEDESFTTQAAAGFLGMSRPYLLRLLEQDKIPFYFVGTHRRILLKHLLEFKAERDKERREALANLTKAVDAAGVYDRY